MFKHPKYYKELRKRNKAARIPPTSSGQAASDQAISDEASTEATSVRPGPGLKPQATEASSIKPKRRASSKASSIKPTERQASSD